MMTFKVKLRASKKARTSGTRFDLEKLKDPEVAEAFRGELAGKFAPLLLLEHDSQVLSNEFTDIMEKTAEEKLGKARKIKKAWMTMEILECCDKGRGRKGRGI